MENLKIYKNVVVWNNNEIGKIINGDAVLAISVQDLVSKFKIYEAQEIVNSVDNIVNELVKMNYNVRIDGPMPSKNLSELVKQYDKLQKK